MKTRNLIICIITGWLLCAIVALIFVAVPIYLPPVFPKQKKEYTERRIQKFEYEFSLIFRELVRKAIEDVGPTLEKILSGKKDTWGTPYWYKVIKWDVIEFSGVNIEICSSGPDKKPNTRDDIIKEIKY